jgi:hypothetical protein
LKTSSLADATPGASTFSSLVVILLRLLQPHSHSSINYPLDLEYLPQQEWRGKLMTPCPIGCIYYLVDMTGEQRSLLVKAPGRDSIDITPGERPSFNPVASMLAQDDAFFTCKPAIHNYSIWKLLA